jgi:DedD protein
VELLVKERLTGAIILVVLIVLLVPELLSGPKGPAVTAPAGTAPLSSEEPPLRSYTINLGDDSHSEPAGSAAASPPGSATGTAGPAMPQPGAPEQPIAQSGSPQAGTADANGSSATSSPIASSQSTETPRADNSQSADSATANSAMTNSQASQQDQSSPKQPSSREQQASRTAKSAAQSSSDAAQKPVAARTEASKPVRTAAAEKPAKGHSAAAANTATNSESGTWAVQLGVFRSHENAERLALEVRVKGFKTSVSAVTSGKSKLYRVRVGPTADRSAAQELQGRLKAAGRPGGTIVPYSG